MRALLAIAAALMLWEGFVRLTGLPPYLLPGPLAVGRAKQRNIEGWKRPTKK